MRALPGASLGGHTWILVFVSRPSDVCFAVWKHVLSVIGVLE